jgi:hypothetical protein
MNSNPYQVSADENAVTSTGPKSRSFGKWHLGTFVLLWLLFGGLYAVIVEWGLDDQPGKWFRVLMTPTVTLISPMVGAFSRGATSGCCFETSTSVLLYVFPVPLLTLASQYFWRPSQLAARVIRCIVWLLLWFVWFASGILPLGHALS